MDNGGPGTRRIRISAAGVELEARLDSGPVADALWSALPIRQRAQLWGDEIYFNIPAQAPIDASSERETVELGTIGFWPPGNALCLFYGPTPMSRGDEIRPASPVNVVGAMEGDPRQLRNVPGGAVVLIERI